MSEQLVKKRRPLGDKIRLTRRKKGWSRPFLAELLSISESYLAHLERESPVHLSESLLERLCIALEFDISSIVVRELARKQNISARDYYRSLRHRNRQAG